MGTHKRRHITAIIDLQFGSTGKGLIAGYLAERDAPDTLVTAWAANAGHTYINAEGRKFVHTMLANGVVSPRLRNILIGPGSVIDPDNLHKEISECQDLLYGLDRLKDEFNPLGDVRIWIHENAAVIQQRHRDEEAGPMTKIGSTKKGCGAAAIQRIRRDPDDLNTARILDRPHGDQPAHPLIMRSNVNIVTPLQYANILDGADIIQIEGAQGYSLSMYHGFYPYTTSRDVSMGQLVADCAIPFQWMWSANIVGTARTFPIRVANRFDEGGKQIGYSGPGFADQTETSFEALGQATELTTVTKLPRRIFTFSEQQITEAIRMCGVTEVFLNFCNYVQESADLKDIIAKIERSAVQVRYLGYGPTVKNVTDLRHEAA